MRSSKLLLKVKTSLSFCGETCHQISNPFFTMKLYRHRLQLPGIEEHNKRYPDSHGAFFAVSHCWLCILSRGRCFYRWRNYSRKTASNNWSVTFLGRYHWVGAKESLELFLCDTAQDEAGASVEAWLGREANLQLLYLPKKASHCYGGAPKCVICIDSMIWTAAACFVISSCF